MDRLNCRRQSWCALGAEHRGPCCASHQEAERAACLDLARIFDEASQCSRCGEYGRAHLPSCPSHPRKASMSRYRVVFNIPPAASAVQFVDAESTEEAIAKVAVEHDGFRLVSCTVERGPISVIDQRDGLIRALRPLYTVCRALLDNPHAAPLFTEQMRKGLDGMCSDAAEALKAAGVER